MLRSLFSRTAHTDTTDAAGEIQITLTDFDSLERDLGRDQADRVQQLLATRLQRELGRYDQLHSASQGMFSIGVRDPDAVDLDKLAAHFVAAIEADPVSLNRALIECTATATVMHTTEPLPSTATG